MWTDRRYVRPDSVDEAVGGRCHRSLGLGDSEGDRHGARHGHWREPHGDHRPRGPLCGAVAASRKLLGFGGFATGTASGVTVPAATSTTVNLHLSLGTTEQKITVQAASEMLQTENAANGETTDQVKVTGLPLTNRNYTEILQLNPGIASSLPNFSR